MIDKGVLSGKCIYSFFYYMELKIFRLAYFHSFFSILSQAIF